MAEKEGFLCASPYGLLKVAPAKFDPRLWLDLIKLACRTLCFGLEPARVIPIKKRALRPGFIGMAEKEGFLCASPYGLLKVAPAKFDPRLWLDLIKLACRTLCFGLEPARVIPIKKRALRPGFIGMAEKEGFEPSKRL